MFALRYRLRIDCLAGDRMKKAAFLVVLLFVLVFSIVPQPVSNATTTVRLRIKVRSRLRMGTKQVVREFLSFAQTNPADGNDFWPDGYNNSVTNSYDRYNFAGIGNWVSYNIGTGESKGTSGDYLYLKVHTSGADHWVGVYSNRVSFTAASLGNTYIEIRFWANCTGQAAWRVSGYTADALGGTGWLIKDLTQIANTWTTYRASLPNTNALECISIQIELTTGQPALEFRCDYLLLTPSTMGGWQHDCSDTGNISTVHVAATPSGGDIVTLTANSISPHTATFSVDNTATVAGLSPSIYPLFELSVTNIVGASEISLDGYAGGGWVSIYPDSILTMNRKYLSALSTSEWSQFRFTFVSVGDSITIDWIAMYAITNFTTTITGGGINDVAYVSSGALQVTKSTATLFQFDRNPAISVAAATYQRWNISTATPSAVGCSLYVSPSWTTRDGDTTWATPNGTVSDMIIRIKATCAISAFKFLVDTSVPVCLWSYAAPTSPTPSQPVTLSAVVTDTYPPTAYKVFFHPLIYPSGFSGVDYLATKQANNVWNYTFSSLPFVGYYVFLIVGTDGRNNCSLSATTYLTFSVAVPTFALVSSATPQVGDNWITFGFVSNKGTATYYVWDNSTLIGGSNEGFYQVAKPNVVGLHNYSILINSSQTTVDSTHQVRNFAASSLWIWQNFKYTVNAVTLAITDRLAIAQDYIISFLRNNHSCLQCHGVRSRFCCRRDYNPTSRILQLVVEP